MTPRSRGAVPVSAQQPVIIWLNNKKLHLSIPSRLQSYLRLLKTGQETGTTVQSELRGADTP